MTTTHAAMPQQGDELSRADNYYRLTYSDPTGESAVRNITGRTVQISWENGAMVSVDIDDIRPFLKSLEFRESRKGRIWGKRKKNVPAGQGEDESQRLGGH